MALVDLGGKESREAISAARDREPDPEVRLLLGSCLAALGGEAPGEAIETRFRERLAGARGERGMFDWDPDYNRGGIRFVDLAANRIRSGDHGDRESLEALADCMKDGPNFLALAMAGSVEGFPIWDLYAIWERGFGPGNQARFAAWWDGNREKVRWDPGRRLFVTP